jgi:Bacterial regulatory protein, Fis family
MAGDFPANVRRAEAQNPTGNDKVMLTPLEEIERCAIFRALRETGDDKPAAARLLGIGKTTVYRKLKQYAQESSRTATSKEIFPMASFLICSNAECRFIVDLREGAQLLPRSELTINECPECAHSWSNSCPFCSRELETTLHDDLLHCSHCGQALRAKAIT